MKRKKGIKGLEIKSKKKWKNQNEWIERKKVTKGIFKNARIKLHHKKEKVLRRNSEKVTKE